MEGDRERRQGSIPHNPTVKGTPDISSTLSSTDQLRDDAVGPMEASSAFASPDLTVEVREAIDGEPPTSTDQQRTALADQENSSRTRESGQGLWVDRGGADHHNDDSDDSYDDMRLDIDGMSYEQLLELGEHIGYVSTGLKEEVVMANLKGRRRSSSTMDSPFDGETCCICQEEFADDEYVGQLDCGHEYHMNCIKEWLSKKNSCPVCKKTALAT